MQTARHRERRGLVKQTDIQTDRPRERESERERERDRQTERENEREREIFEEHIKTPKISYDIQTIYLFFHPSSALFLFFHKHIK